MEGEKELFNNYPQFFYYANEEELDTEVLPTIKTVGIECSNGWKNIIEDLAEKVESINRRKECRICAVQIKEKFGGLRVYIDVIGEDKSLKYKDYKEIINRAEERSFKTCENCGNKGKLISDGGWYRTRCSDCVDMTEVDVVEDIK